MSNHKELLFKIKKNKHLLFVLILIVFAAGFLRFWHLEDWMLFRADQARDAFYAREAAVSGVGELRILGPKIDIVHLDQDVNERGNTVHMGPWYYYLQFLMFKVSGNTSPWILGVPEALFFLASIPLFFLVSRFFFNRKLSILLTAVYAFSFFNLLYTRFYWNPNQLFFWILLIFLGLLNLSKLDAKKEKFWYPLLTLCLLVTSQLHMIAFLGFSALLIYALVIYKPLLPGRKTVLKMFLIFCLFMLPLLASDLVNNFDNSSRLIRLFVKNNQTDTALWGKITDAARDVSEFSAFSLTTLNDKELRHVELLGGIIIVVAIIFTVGASRRMKKLGDSSSAKNHALLVFWFLIFFLIYVFISHKLDSPRYFIPISPLIVLLLGILIREVANFDYRRFSPQSLVYVSKKYSFFSYGFGYLVLGLALFINFHATYSWFESLESGSGVVTRRPNIKIPPHNELITYGNLKNAFEHMSSIALNNNNFVCFRSANYQYHSPIEYIAKNEFQKVDIERFDEADRISNCSYLFLTRKKKGKDDIPKEYFENFKITNRKTFGALAVYELELTTREKLSFKSPSKEIEKFKELQENSRIENWGGVFAKKNNE